jgi:hypothetical protein
MLGSIIRFNLLRSLMIFCLTKSALKIHAVINI